ncbi:MAG: hypothetical protein WC164_03900 [Patescibacteria group bacterium]
MSDNRDASQGVLHMQMPMNPSAARRHNCIDFFSKKPLRRASWNPEILEERQ